MQTRTYSHAHTHAHSFDGVECGVSLCDRDPLAAGGVEGQDPAGPTAARLENAAAVQQIHVAEEEKKKKKVASGSERDALLVS